MSLFCFFVLLCVDALAFQLRRIAIQSQALRKEMHYVIWLPDSYTPQKEYPLIVMLHGLGDSDTNWSRGRVPRQLQGAINAQIIPEHIVIVPNGERGYWVNQQELPYSYEDWVFEALTDAKARFSVSRSIADHTIMGVSMGGWGALSIGLRHPEIFGQIVSLSPTDIFIATEKQPDRPLYTQAFGDPLNPYFIASRSPRELLLRGAGTQQRLAIAVGTAEPDKFYKGVQAIKHVCHQYDISLSVLEIPQGKHDWQTTWTEDTFMWWFQWLGALY